MSAKTYIELVREIFPDAGDGEVEFILWEKTAFPFCDPAYLRKQLVDFKAALETGKPLCDMCNGIADESLSGSWPICKSCNDALSGSIEAVTPDSAVEK